MPDTARLPLVSASPGTDRALTVHRYGRRGARPKVHIQAALHADELPGILVIDHLLRLLDAAEAAGRIAGEIVVVPVANPIGLDQVLNGHLLGRFDLAAGVNFNRLHCDLADAVVQAVDGRLGDDPAANVAAVRAALRAAYDAAAPAPVGQAEHLKRLLFGLAHDADLVLDLHCDWEAVMHLYTATASWPDVADIARQLGAEAVLTAGQSGDVPFDEALSWPWMAVAARWGDRFPVPQGCHSLTVELRGQSDVDDSLAAADAANLLAVLIRRGAVAGDPGPLPAARCDASPLEAVDMVKAPAAGVLVYAHAVGARVDRGAVLGHVVNPLADDAAGRRVPFTAGTAGIVYGRLAQRLVRPGDVICKVAGSTILAHRTGKLLTA
ncbi:succinylglutamate desuccinylase/aspartoacylase family protein [Caenispirillum bisanense]|uniref:succinylglutamate desuccinylase/aspartoacylase family protein n=1 Tax=Caenispirillum bisanense TaxID=414052 RepID=UPI0031DBE12A